MEAKMRLREWLIAQIDSGQYEGLCWEKEDKTMFRIPWKHAAKKDYNQDEDAALFKAWAVYKGKYRQGRDLADPTMWKTRLRCALNKSTDFQEVVERSQLDISEPYKVYRVQPDTSIVITEFPKIENRLAIWAGEPNSPARDPTHPQGPTHSQGPQHSQNRGPPHPQLHRERESLNEDENNVPNVNDVLMREHMYCGLDEGRPRHRHSPPLTFLSPMLAITDFRMQVRLLYQGHIVTEVSTSSPDGCFILQGSVPLGNERIYGPCSAQQLSFPSPEVVFQDPGITEAMGCLLPHLERGILLWVAPDGVFVKRFCQGRVYWSGPLAEHTDRPNKLNRERTCKLLDMPIFHKELQDYIHGEGSRPHYEIDLCFGEEFPDPNIPKCRKLIVVEVVPLFAVELLQRYHRGESEEKLQAHTLNADREKVVGAAQTLNADREGVGAAHTLNADREGVGAAHTLNADREKV